jgi:putative phosphoribosyl transferase
MDEPYVMFLDRRDAAQQLARALKKYTHHDHTCLLGLTRGGVVLAAEIATRLHLPVDAFIVRKIGAPDNPEYAIGAISEGGVVEINNDVVRSSVISWEYIDQQIVLQTQKIEHQKELYRGNRSLLDVGHQSVIIVDDGLATGYTMRVAIQDVRSQQASKIVVAVPVGPVDTVTELKKIVDEVICLKIPSIFFAVGNHYIDFSPVSDEEVVSLMKRFEKIKKEV